MDLLELAALCEAATGPDYELSKAISRAVGTWQPPDRGDPYGTAKPYTKSLDAATTLVPEGWECIIASDGHATVRKSGGGKAVRVENCASPALALCAAALRARASQTTADDGDER